MNPYFFFLFGLKSRHPLIMDKTRTQNQALHIHCFYIFPSSKWCSWNQTFASARDRIIIQNHLQRTLQKQHTHIRKILFFIIIWPHKKYLYICFCCASKNVMSPTTTSKKKKKTTRLLLIFWLLRGCEWNDKWKKNNAKHAQIRKK